MFAFYLFLECDENYYYSIVPIATRAAAILSDLIGLIVILAKTINIRRGAQRHQLKSPLATVILTEGDLGFITHSDQTMLG